VERLKRVSCVCVCVLVGHGWGVCSYAREREGTVTRAAHAES
jgi:hypothetical protein